MTDYLSTRMSPRLRALARRCATSRGVVAPVSTKHDAEHSFPVRVESGIADIDLFGLPFPRSTAASAVTISRCLPWRWRNSQGRPERRHHAGSRSLAGRDAGVPFGNEAQKQKWLPLLASGKALGAFGLTEAGGGSDAGATKTTAKLDTSTG